MPDHPVLLDTHAWIWMIMGQSEQLSDRAIAEINAAAETGEILVPVIAVWEVGMLESKGRLSLSRPVEDWVTDGLRAPGVRLLDLSPEIAIESTRLPGAPHLDPADRIMIASTRITGGRLATKDQAILDYAEGGHLQVMDVGR
jgi:PIN domain nuclease of toxin-antitoxin system